MFVVELVEGKSHPYQSGLLEFEELGGKIVILLLCMIKCYFDTGRYLILDSGFCVLIFFELRTKGVLACAVIKERKYWTSMVTGKFM